MNQSLSELYYGYPTLVLVFSTIGFMAFLIVLIYPIMKIYERVITRIRPMQFDDIPNAFVVSVVFISLPFFIKHDFRLGLMFAFGAVFMALISIYSIKLIERRRS